MQMAFAPRQSITSRDQNAGAQHKRKQRIQQLAVTWLIHVRILAGFRQKSSTSQDLSVKRLSFVMFLVVNAEDAFFRYPLHALGRYELSYSLIPYIFQIFDFAHAVFHPVALIEVL
jgi:hypothetical protein